MVEKKEGRVQPSDSSKKLKRQENQEGSASLSKNLSLELMGLIKKVNENEVTPESVNASCNAANQIHKILKLNYEMKKEGF